MQRTKLALGILTLSLALLGTGYALWTDTLTLSGIVTTATFCVQFKDQPKLKPGFKPEDYEITSISASLVNPTTNGKYQYSHDIAFTIENLKPGVPIEYTTKIQNLSSIKAKLDSIAITQGSTISNIKLIILFKKDIVFEGLLNQPGDKKINVILDKKNNKSGGKKDEVDVTFIYEGVDYTSEAEPQTLNFTTQINWKQVPSTIRP